MAKGDDLYKNNPQSQMINNNAIMNRGGMTSQMMQQPLMRSETPNFMQSLFPNMFNMGQGNNAGGASGSNSLMNRLRGNIEKLRGNQAQSRNGMPNREERAPADRGRARSVDSISRASSIYGPNAGRPMANPDDGFQFKSQDAFMQPGALERMQGSIGNRFGGTPGFSLGGMNMGSLDQSGRQPIMGGQQQPMMSNNQNSGSNFMQSLFPGQNIRRLS